MKIRIKLEEETVDLIGALNTDKPRIIHANLCGSSSYSCCCCFSGVAVTPTEIAMRWWCKSEQIYFKP
ncbi:hypothetical protein AB1303_13635 [Saccharolobus solfataricus]